MKENIIAIVWWPGRLVASLSNLLLATLVSNYIKISIPNPSLGFSLPCAFAFAFTLAVAYGTLIIVESSSHSIFVVFSLFLCFCFCCIYFFNALWIIDWDRGLRGPSITLFVYMIILDCPLRPLGFGICRWFFILRLCMLFFVCYFSVRLYVHVYVSTTTTTSTICRQLPA